MDANSAESTGTTASLVGRTLSNRYRILAKLGEGAMGDVYVGEHLTIGRRDAIKVLRPALADNAEAIARFTRGTRNVSAIRHPNVCTIYDFSDTPEGLRFLAMEYVDGKTLKEVLDSEGKFELGRAVEIARQVAGALQAAHDAGVVHRDLKPANIMLCLRDGVETVKVVDFDIAKGPSEPEGEELTRAGYVVGTPEYMSPEQLAGERLDGRSDLYSLGIVLFRMLTGKLPFRAASAQEIMVQRLTMAPMMLGEIMPDAPLPLQDAIARALARDKDERQENSGEFAREIAAALRSSETELPPTRVYRAAPQAQGTAPTPRRVPMLAVVGTFAAIGAVVVVLVLNSGKSDPPQEPTGLNEPTGVATANPPGGAGDAGGGALKGAGIDSVAGKTTGSNNSAGRTTITGNPDSAKLAIIPPPAFPGGISNVLERQLQTLGGTSTPTAAILLAVSDTGRQAWAASTTRADSADAAFVVAQAAFLATKNAECVFWANRGRELRPAGFDFLLQNCRQ